MFTGALLFDFDGLLVDTESAALRAWQETFREHDTELPRSAMLAWLGRRTDTLDPGETWLKAKARIVALLEDEGPRAGVVTYLDTAREHGLRLAVASGATRDWVVPRLRDVGLLDAFDAVVTGDGRPSKPAPDVYLAALDAVGAEAAIAFEDTPVGVTAANAAGISCVAVPNPVTAVLDFPTAAQLTSQRPASSQPLSTPSWQTSTLSESSGSGFSEA
ncbi:HAD family hydrolase [Amycolatopsis sp. NPDC058278]|uniref:HAD family hydrolase n=1 Tax=Amycolatopsis sp. NPDC058278 TaxID=3346417 RepID=UPI0036DA0334